MLGVWFSDRLDTAASLKEQVKQMQDFSQQEAKGQLMGGFAGKIIETKAHMSINCLQFWQSPFGSLALVTIIAGLWLLLGTLFGLYSAEDMSASEAFEFAFSALTTGGMFGLSAENNSLRDESAIFGSIYCLVGVPLYCVWISKHVSMLMIEDRMKKGQQEAIEELQAFEMSAAGGDSETVDLDVAKQYMEQVLPLLCQEEVRVGRAAELKVGNPSMVDALLLSLIQHGQLDVGYITGFHAAWQDIVGARINKDAPAAAPTHAGIVSHQGASSTTGAIDGIPTGGSGALPESILRAAQLLGRAPLPTPARPSQIAPTDFEGS